LQRVGRFLQGALVLGWASWAQGIDWPAWKVLVLAFAFAGAIAFFYALFIMQAALSFWATESLEIMNTVTYGGIETARYPLAIDQPWFRHFFTFVVPLGCVTYFPSVAIFGIEDPLGSSFAFQVLAPSAGFLFFGLALVCWRVGVRQYTSTGS